MDFAARAGVHTIGVDVSAYDPDSPDTLKAFEKKMQDLNQTGGPTPRAVILTNPHNPLGKLPPHLQACRALIT